MVSDLYKRTLYLNKDIEYLFGHRIIEYDIRSAGFNIIRHFKFVPQKVIDALAKLDKHSRHVAIGMMERNNEDLKKKMKLGFQSCRKKFFVENNVQDEEILSIKKDAIFLIDRVLTNTKFDTIEFVNKNEYQSYLYMNKIEFYIGDEKIDCKGIRDEKVKLHEKFMLEIIREFSRLMVESDKEHQLRFIKEVANAYRNRELEAGYYRELNKESLYRPSGNIEVMTNHMGYSEFDLDLKYLDIGYNYTHYIIPMYQILL